MEDEGFSTLWTDTLHLPHSPHCFLWCVWQDVLDWTGRLEACWLWCRKLLSTYLGHWNGSLRRMVRQMVWNPRFQLATHHTGRPRLEVFGSGAPFHSISCFSMVLKPPTSSRNGFLSIDGLSSWPSQSLAFALHSPGLLLPQGLCCVLPHNREVSAYKPPGSSSSPPSLCSFKLHFSHFTALSETRKVIFLFTSLSDTLRKT